eukprot:Sspe_Gene.80477::Locus_50853_Transcript_1_1_Confidence_1.000_Length_785::g.80477::m.80477
MVSKAAAYIQGAAQGEMGPWAPPGLEWPKDWKGQKEFWYPLVKKGKEANRMFPSHENKNVENRFGNEKWATDGHGDLCCVWAQDCPYSFFNCAFGYFCPLCAIYIQRRKLLLHDVSNNYECCAGLWGAKCTKMCNKVTEGNE